MVDLLSQRIEQEAKRLGFDLVGIAPLGPSDQAAFYRRWLKAGHHGTMDYLAREDAVEMRVDPMSRWPELRSVVVVGHFYPSDPAPRGGEGGRGRGGGASGAEALSDPSAGIIARYARGRDYHRVVKKKLLALLRFIEGRIGHELPEARAYVDTGPVLERELGRRAGLGWFGRNTMLIHPRRGSYFFLGELLLPLDLDYDEPFEADHCGTCRACLDACPTGALLGRDEDGAPVMNANLCISYLTIEHEGAIPRELRPAIENHVFGCDICQEVCPFNNARFVQVTAERDYLPRRSRPGSSSISRTGEGGWRGERDLPGTEAPSLVELMDMSEEEWDVFTHGSAIRRAGYAGFRRNVAVGLGNWLRSVQEPPEGALTVLAEALEDEESLVREHAAWAAVGRGAGGDPS